MSVFASIWSFILTLVRSLLALFSFHRRSPTASDALSHAHAHLRPIVLTPKSLSPARYTQRTSSATSTLHQGQLDNSQTSGPQRTSPKLDSLDPELGFPAAGDLPSLRDGTPDTSLTGSSYVAPLTPPDRCYLAPLPSTTDCPYAEPWPTNVPTDRCKSKLPGSPLRVSVNTNTRFPGSMVVPIGSPPPARWSPLEIWTSTPFKNESPAIPDQAHCLFDQHKDSSAMANISHALISRSQGSIRPYDDAFRSSMSSSTSSLGDHAKGPRPTRELRRTQAHFLQSKNHPFPRFHHPDAYAYAWRHHGARLPGKTNRMLTHVRSRSYNDLQTHEWYDSAAYAPSPVVALSPPLGESATEEEDEDELPLGRLRERLARRNAGLGITDGAGMRKAARLTPHTRRMSEGCLLALYESTPTRIGFGTRSSRHAISLALEGDGREVKDWLEALSLRYSSEQEDVRRSVPPRRRAVRSVEVATG